MSGPDFKSKLASHDSVKSIEALSHVGRSKSHVDPGGRSKPKHRSDLLDGSDQADQGLGVKISPDVNSPAFGKQYLQNVAFCAATASASGNLYPNQPLRFTLPLCFRPVPFQPTLQCAQR
jgi:hypothetical protein